MTGDASAARATPAPANIWAVTWRFLRRGRPYLPRILLTILIVLIASGAKTVQGFLVKPVIDLAAKPSEGALPPDRQAERLREALRLTDEQAAEVRAILERQDGDLRSVLDEGQKRAYEEHRSGGRRADGKGGVVSAWVRDLFKPSRWNLGLIAALAIGLSGVMFVFGYLRDYMTNWLTNRVVADLRDDVAEHLAYLPLRYHYDRRSGDLVSRTTNDVNVSESATNFYFDDAIVHPIMITWAMGAAFYTNWKLALGALVLFPFYALVLARLGRKMRRARKKSLEHLGDMTGTMIQTFGGIKVVKAFNTEAAQVEEFRAHNESFFRKLMTSIRRKALGENISQLFMGLAIAVLLVGGYALLEKRAMTPGDMAFFGLAIAMINSSVRELSKSYNRLVEASTGCERVFEILDQPRETEHESGEELPRVEGLEFRDVSFAYDGTWVLQGVSFSARPGQVIAVVGRSGAGKTTLVDLLCRFYDPQKGHVAVNGRDLRRVRRSSLLSRVAVVTQETFLFNTTIAENIRYGRKGASAPEVEAAAKAAHIHDFIAGLEAGYDTRVGERGAKLSGGQRQRIAIARAVLRDPDLLILDEATSALDSESEQAVQAALQNLIRADHRITFVIAHRLSTVRNADRILVLDEGRLVEEGTHEALLARGGVYAALHRTQFTE
jgi:subfamily B ATP-binding cassette protein MsbA